MTYFKKIWENLKLLFFYLTGYHHRLNLIYKYNTIVPHEDITHAELIVVGSWVIFINCNDRPITGFNCIDLKTGAGIILDRTRNIKARYDDFSITTNSCFGSLFSEDVHFGIIDTTIQENYIKITKDHTIYGHVIDYHQNISGGSFRNLRFIPHSDFRNTSIPALTILNRQDNSSTEYYMYYNELHREDGPAVIKRTPEVTIYRYYKDRELHREDGPAEVIIKKDSLKQNFYYKGILLTEKLFDEMNALRNFSNYGTFYETITSSRTYKIWRNYTTLNGSAPNIILTGKVINESIKNKIK